MILSVGEKLHVVYRAMFEQSTRRHFIGEVTAVDGAMCRLEGYAYVYDTKSTMFVRKPEKRITIIDASESGYIINVINADVVLNDVVYRYIQNVGLIATDNKAFSLDINEFSAKS